MRAPIWTLAALVACGGKGTSSSGAAQGSTSSGGRSSSIGGSAHSSTGTAAGGSSSGSPSSVSSSGAASTSGGSSSGATGGPDAGTLPAAGNPDGSCTSLPLPTEAQPVDTTVPTTVVGTGTPSSCTFAALANAVSQGGIITFDCGDGLVTIPVTATLTPPTSNAYANEPPLRIVIDGETRSPWTAATPSRSSPGTTSEAGR